MGSRYANSRRGFWRIFDMLPHKLVKILYLLFPVPRSAPTNISAILSSYWRTHLSGLLRSVSVIFSGRLFFVPEKTRRRGHACYACSPLSLHRAGSMIVSPWVTNIPDSISRIHRIIDLHVMTTESCPEFIRNEVVKLKNRKFLGISFLKSEFMVKSLRPYKEYCNKIKLQLISCMPLCISASLVK